MEAKHWCPKNATSQKHNHRWTHFIFPKSCQVAHLVIFLARCFRTKHRAHFLFPCKAFDQVLRMFKRNWILPCILRQLRSPFLMPRFARKCRSFHQPRQPLFSILPCRKPASVGVRQHPNLSPQTASWNSESLWTLAKSAHITQNLWKPFPNPFSFTVKGWIMKLVFGKWSIYPTASHSMWQASLSLLSGVFPWFRSTSVYLTAISGPDLGRILRPNLRAILLSNF